MTISHTITPSRTRLPPSRTRFQSQPGWAFCCKWQKIVKNRMNEESTRAVICVQEAEKSPRHKDFSTGEGCKKEGP